jgi:WD40 repeat protein
VDDKANKYGDLYIRSVCFSPDGKYLATGAEDRQIRVSYRDEVPFFVAVNFMLGNIDLGYCKTAYSKCL